jgi:hypothetical protein
LELASILFTANISGCRIPRDGCEWNALFRSLLFLVNVILNVQKVRKARENNRKERHIERPCCCLYEFVPSGEE